MLSIGKFGKHDIQEPGKQFAHFACAETSFLHLKTCFLSNSLQATFPLEGLMLGLHTALLRDRLRLLVECIR